MTPLAICVLAYCLVAEGHTRQCVRSDEPDAVIQVEQPLHFSMIADLSPGFTTVEHRACARLANELQPPINHRLTEFYVRHQQRGRGARTATQSAAGDSE